MSGRKNKKAITKQEILGRKARLLGLLTDAMKLSDSIWYDLDGYGPDQKSASKEVYKLAPDWGVTGDVAKIILGILQPKTMADIASCEEPLRWHALDYLIQQAKDNYDCIDGYFEEVWNLVDDDVFATIPKTLDGGGLCDWIDEHFPAVSETSGLCGAIAGGETPKTEVGVVESNG